MDTGVPAAPTAVLPARPPPETDIEPHPVASLFPQLDKDELHALADDVKERGLLHPVVLDPQGRVLDRRSRLTACDIAAVEPVFVTYDGNDPSGYVLSANLRRRNLTRGQAAMISVRARSGSEQQLRSDPERTTRSVSEQTGLSLGRISQANTVLQHAADLVDAVINGAMGLDEAYDTARENKAKASSAEVQLARLRQEDPELADRVVEGHLTLAGAWAERTERVEEEKR